MHSVEQWCARASMTPGADVSQHGSNYSCGVGARRARRHSQQVFSCSGHRGKEFLLGRGHSNHAAAVGWRKNNTL